MGFFANISPIGPAPVDPAEVSADSISLRRWVLVVTPLLMSVSLVALAVRLLGKHMKKQLWLDDFFCTASTVRSFCSENRSLGKILLTYLLRS